MQQAFRTRNYSIRDFEEWNGRKELILQPKFQRREVWSEKARSYLMDTIIRGKPIPKVYMRQDIDPDTHQVRREVVDGQQRLKTVLTFMKDAFKISKSHHPDFGGKTYSQLDADTQRDILKYEFVVDLLEDMPDNEVIDLFARINTYSERLKPQELRNAKYFGDFKSSVYELARTFFTFFTENKIFTPKQILRMAEAEFISDLLLAQHDGIQAGAPKVLDNAYKRYDDIFPSRKVHERRFRETVDSIGAIFGDKLAASEFSAIRLFYPLYCAVYHLKFGLPKLKTARKPFKTSDQKKMSVALAVIDDLIANAKKAEDYHQDLTLSLDDKRFYDAFDEHWVHAEKRVILTDYICRKLIRAF